MVLTSEGSLFKVLLLATMGLLMLAVMGVLGALLLGFKLRLFREMFRRVADLPCNPRAGTEDTPDDVIGGLLCIQFKLY